MRYYVYIFFILALFFNLSYAKENKNILLVSGYHQSLPWTTAHNNGIKKYFNEQNLYKVTLFQEYMEILRLGEDFNEELWISYLGNKYKNAKIDAILVDTSIASEFIIKYGKNIFGNIPMVMFSNNHKIKVQYNDVLILQANVDEAIEKTIELAIKQNPKSENLVLIVNNEFSSINILNSMKPKVEKYKKYKFKILNYKSIAQCEEEIAKLDSKSILFYSLIVKDEKGNYLIPKKVLTDFTKISKIPIYSFYSTLIDSGSIGGTVVDSEVIGHSMARAVLDYLNSGKYDSFYEGNRTIFDYEVLKKFNIDESTLPNEVTFVNKEITFFEHYKKEILVISFIVFLLLAFSSYIFFINLKLVKSKEKIIEMNKLIQKKNNELIESQHIAKIGSWSLDIVNNTLIWSDETYSILEIEKDKFAASYEGFLNAIHPDDRNIVNEAYKNSLKNKTAYRIKHRLLVKDEKIKWVMEECKTEFDKDGNPLISIGIIQDITKEQENEEKMHEQEVQLYESQKLASMGEMIGNIAHQWRQPLSVISVAASGMKLKYEMDILSKTDMNEFNKSILDSTEFLSKTIDTFRNFIKEEKIYKEVILQDRIKKAFEIIDVTLKDEFIRLIDDIDYSEPIKINLIVGELAQVILNLINNSKDALIEKNINEPWVKVSIEKLEEKVVIIIEDNAGGIKEDVLPHIFEPYFTTKHQSQGTGLGLYMSKEIVEKHLEGKLYVKNTSEGAKFYVELPLSISI